jgi:hypothetical protein
MPIDCRCCRVPGINADDAWPLIFRAGNKPATGILFENFMPPQCEGEQQQGSSDKAEHEPKEYKHGPPSFGLECEPVLEAHSVMCVTLAEA